MQPITQQIQGRYFSETQRPRHGQYVEGVRDLQELNPAEEKSKKGESARERKRPTHKRKVRVGVGSVVCANSGSLSFYRRFAP